jgi:hypothetical protein
VTVGGLGIIGVTDETGCSFSHVPICSFGLCVLLRYMLSHLCRAAFAFAYTAADIPGVYGRAAEQNHGKHRFDFGFRGVCCSVH